MKTIEELEAELETVTRERDEARADLSDALARIAAIAQALGCDAQALAEDPSVARAEVEALTDERDELLVRVAQQDAELHAARAAYRDAYRRGTEAMREACASAFNQREDRDLTVDVVHDVLADLPIPEEP